MPPSPPTVVRQLHFPTRARLAARERGNVRYINMYFVGFIVFVIGLALALWKAGILAHVAPVWIVIGLVVAIGLGIMMSVGSGKPTITHE
jgi:hypothetical protein